MYGEVPSWMFGPLATAMAVLFLLYLVALLVALATQLPRASADANTKRQKVRAQRRKAHDAHMADVDLESGVAFVPQKISKNQKRKARLLRMPRIPFFNMARHDEAEISNDVEDDAFDLDDEVWTMPQSKMHFIGDSSPPSVEIAQAHDIGQDAFDMNDEVWANPQAAATDVTFSRC
jgi:hypothetical protein